MGVPKIKAKVGLIVCTIFMTSCTSFRIVSRKEVSEFIKSPQINRIDPGYTGERKETRINGYLRYAITPTSGFTYNDTVSSFYSDYRQKEPQLVSYYSGKALEPEFSFGGELTHCITDHIGIGGHFDIAHYWIVKNTPQAFGEYNDDYYGFYQAGFHMRFTKAKGIVTAGYRPEWSLGQISGYRTIIKEYEWNNTVVKTDTTIISGKFSRFHTSFCHSLFCRIDPLKPVGVFAGLQHRVDPYKAFEKEHIVHHSFNFYAGAGLEIADLISINPWVAVPLFNEFRYSDAPGSVGLAAGLIF